MAPKRPVMASPEALAAEAKARLEKRVEASGGPAEPERRRPERPAQPREEITYDSTNERVVIAAQIADRKVRKILSRSISPDEMLLPEHVVMHRALRLMEDQSLEYDGQVFRRLLLDEGVPVDEGYIAGVEADAHVPDNLNWHVETLRWDATRARIIRGSVPELLKVLKDPKATPEQLASAARAVARAAEGGAAGRKHIHRHEELKRASRAELAARVAGGNFWATGYEAIDTSLVEGVMPGNTSAIVGLSGSGKSTFSADFAVRLAEQGRRVLYGAWEMRVQAVLDVMAAARARIPLETIVQGENLSKEEIGEVNAAFDWAADHITFMSNAFFDTEQKGRPSNVRSLDTLEGYIAESGCDVAFYDLWERCLEDLSYDGVTKALYRQQDMHRRYNLHGVIVHQLKLKEVEQRPDKRPTRESVKGSGAFVEVPDLLFGVHRDAQFKKVADDSLEVICLKQRMGKAFWSVRFDWAGEMSLITGGEQVPYDPGLEASREFGDVADIRVEQTNRRKPSRRES
jgi:hypothetical protein